ncbi:MAG: elongation factor G [Tissierellia bacterium]|nr:elongation factor G [Tissierellia bacterium]
MKTYQTEQIRNIALIGHGGCGKTTLSEAALFATGAITRQGRVDDGNTVSDFDKEEIARKVSIGTAVIPIEHGNIKINLVDTPGYFDFVGEVYGALRASESALIVIDASAGVEVGTEKSWKYVDEYKLPRAIFINKMDKENVEFNKVLDELKDQFGDKIVPFTLPIGEGVEFKGVADVLEEVAYEYKGKNSTKVDVPAELQGEIETIKEVLVEKVAETDEELMEKYFEGEEFTKEEIRKGIKESIKNRDLVPVLVGSAENTMAIDILLSFIKDYMPSPLDVGTVVGYKGEEAVERKIDKNEPFSALVFKTIVDPFVGKLSLFKVLTGKLTKDQEIYNSSKDESERLGGLFVLRGKNQLEVPEIVAGDIGATSKLQEVQTGDTLSTKADRIVYERINYPKPTLYKAIEPKSKDDEEKISSALHRLTDEDPSFVVERNAETKQLLVGGQGNMQLTVIIDKLKNQFGVDVTLTQPKVAYRETIKGTASVQGKHKKQTGGAGQYGDVHIRFEPSDQDFEFAEEVFGGAVPKNFFPAVEKGLRESLEHGVLAGYPVVNIKATLFDGSYHPVDSNEMAFKIAASLAFKKGMEEANPVLLEPIMRLEIIVPEEYMGDVMGDMNKRRGRILGMEPLEAGNQLVIAEAPQAELFEYAIDLRSMTQARGSFTMEFLRYEEVPANIAERIIEESREKAKA